MLTAEPVINDNDDSLDAILDLVDLDTVGESDAVNPETPMPEPGVAITGGPTQSHLNVLKQVFGHQCFRGVQWDIVQNAFEKYVGKGRNAPLTDGWRGKNT
jgi:hypothetical protein